MLELIDQRHKGPAVNEILAVIRSGVTDMFEIKHQIRKNCTSHILRYQRNGWEIADYWHILLHNIDEADADIQKYLDYEKLSPEEKQKLKQGKGQFFAKESMKDKPVTEAQKKYLIGLGFKGKFDEMSRYDASVFIEKLKN
jgi:hypothetical protein